MSTREFPRFGSGEELTAQQVNAVLDQMRRQSRVFATPPLEAVQTPSGWLVRTRDIGGFWAAVGDVSDGPDGLPTYDYREVAPSGDGAWGDVPGGRRGEGVTGAVEVNGVNDVIPGTIVRMVPAASDVASAAFSAPPKDTRTAPTYFWGEIVGETDSGYEYAVVRYAEGTFVAGRTAAPKTDVAREANGKTGIADGTVVLMRLDEGLDQLPVFVASSVGTAFWAMRFGAVPGNDPPVPKYPLPLNMTLALTGGDTTLSQRDVVPTGGTWTFKVTLGTNFYDPGAVLEVASTPLPYNATVDEVRGAIEQLTSFPYGDLQVSGTDGGPWTFHFRGTLAGTGGVRIVTDLLEYEGETPLSYFFARATGPWSAMVSAEIEGGGTAEWVEVERSTGGSWYVARGIPRSIEDRNVIPTNGGTAIVDGDVVYMELARTVPGLYPLLPTIDATGLTGGTGTVIPSGDGAVISITATGGTFTLVVDGWLTPAIAYNATAQDVADAANSRPTEDDIVTASGGPLPGTVRLDWVSGTTRGADRLIYSYERHNPPTRNYGDAVGTTRLGLAGYEFNEIQEIRLHSPGGFGYPTGGTFTLKYGDDKETEAIAFDATYQDVQDALENLDGFAGAVRCSGGPLPGTVRVEFVGPLAGTEIDLPTFGDNSLTTDDDDNFEADPEVIRPLARIVRTNGQVAPTVPATTPFTMTCGAQSIPAGNTYPVGLTSVRLQKLAGQYFTSAFGSLGTYISGGLVSCQGPPGGPWRFDFAGKFAKTMPSTFSFATTSPGVYTVTSADSDAKGFAGEIDDGLLKFAVGAFWKLELEGGAGASVRLLVNGSLSPPISHGSSPSSVINAMVSGGYGFTDSNPLGPDPTYLSVLSLAPHRPLPTLSVASTAFAAPATAHPRLSCVVLREVADDAVYLEIASDLPLTSGTWTFPDLATVDHTGAVLYPAPVLNWNATASEVRSAITGYTRDAGSFGLTTSVWLGYHAFPFVNATCTGGPLHQAPIVVKIPTGLSEPWRTRNYIGPGVSNWGLNAFDVGAAHSAILRNSSPYPPMATPDVYYALGADYASMSLLLGADAAGLSATPVGPASATLTWLGTADLDPATLTAASLEAALRATTNGADVVVTDPGDGLWTVSLPDYDGPEDPANWCARVHMYGWVSGGRMRFFYNAAPRAGFDTLRDTASGSAATELNGAWGATTIHGILGSTGRTDERVAALAPGGFRAKVVRNEGLAATGVYPWAERFPGPERMPRTSADGQTYYDGELDLTRTSATNNFTALEVAADKLVPDATEVWLTPNQGIDGGTLARYFFRWTATLGVPRFARVTSPNLLNGARHSYVGGTPCYLGGSFDVGAAYKQMLSEAGTDDLTDNTGRKLAEVVPPLYDRMFGFPPYTADPNASGILETGRYAGIYPNVATPPGTGGTSSSGVAWATPRGEPDTTAFYPDQNAYIDEPQYGLLRAHYYQPAQQFGNGDKAIDGSVFVWMGSSYPRYFSQMPTYGGSAPAAGLTTPGRSPAASLTITTGQPTIFNPEPESAPGTITFGSFGSITIYVYTSLTYIQAAMDALVGVDNCYVSVSTTPGVNFYFDFSVGSLAAVEMGDVSFTNSRMRLTGVMLPSPNGVSAADAATRTDAMFYSDVPGIILDGGGAGLGAYEQFFNYTGGYEGYRTERFASLVAQYAAMYVASPLPLQFPFVCGLRVTTGPIVDNIELAPSLWPGAVFSIGQDYIYISLHSAPEIIPPMQAECAAGVGMRYAVAQSFSSNYVPYPETNPYPHGGHLIFQSGFCIEARMQDDPGYTGTFPTTDGRTVTCLNGFIMSVA